jgi:hypothetical protein
LDISDDNEDNDDRDNEVNRQRWQWACAWGQRWQRLLVMFCAVFLESSFASCCHDHGVSQNFLALVSAACQCSPVFVLACASFDV